MIKSNQIARVALFAVGCASMGGEIIFIIYKASWAIVALFGIGTVAALIASYLLSQSIPDGKGNEQRKIYGVSLLYIKSTPTGCGTSVDTSIANRVVRAESKEEAFGIAYEACKEQFKGMKFEGYAATQVPEEWVQGEEE